MCRGTGSATVVPAAVPNPFFFLLTRSNLSAKSLIKLARLEGESSNSFFSDLEDWEAQLKPHEALLPEMEP